MQYLKLSLMSNNCVVVHMNRICRELPKMGSINYCVVVVAVGNINCAEKPVKLFTVIINNFMWVPLYFSFRVGC